MPTELQINEPSQPVIDLLPPLSVLVARLDRNRQEANMLRKLVRMIRSRQRDDARLREVEGYVNR